MALPTAKGHDTRRVDLGFLTNLTETPSLFMVHAGSANDARRQLLNAIGITISHVNHLVLKPRKQSHRSDIS